MKKGDGKAVGIKYEKYVSSRHTIHFTDPSAASARLQKENERESREEKDSRRHVVLIRHVKVFLLPVAGT